MWIVAVAWLYVVLMMAVAEALSTQGSVLGAVFTFVLYGVLPLAIVLYLLGTPLRRRAAKQAAAAPTSSDERDRSGHPAGDPVTPERKEP